MSDLCFLLDSSIQSQPSDDFEIFLNSPITMKGIPHEVALINFSGWFSFFNIDGPGYGNNIFRYSANSGGSFTDATIPNGNYNLEQLQTAVQLLLHDAGHFTTVDGIDTYPVNFTPNFSTQRLYIELDATYQIDFTSGNLNALLGFSASILTASAYGSTNVDITNSINQILIRCSLINGGSYLNSNGSDILYTFTPNVPPGSSITISPFNRIYLPIGKTDSFNKIRITITDQMGRRVNFNGENTTTFIHVRPRKTIDV